MIFRFIFLIFFAQSVITPLEQTLFYHKHPDAINYNGIVVSSNEYASEIGIEILKNP